jgi:hypothetical protein
VNEAAVFSYRAATARHLRFTVVNEAAVFSYRAATARHLRLFDRLQPSCRNPIKSALSPLLASDGTGASSTNLGETIDATG